MVTRHVLEMSNELRPKASSLTKLRDYLQRRKMAGVDATPTKWPSSLHTFTDWRPRGLHHKICIQAKCGKKSRPIPISLPGLTPIPLCNTVSSSNKRHFIPILRLFIIMLLLLLLLILLLLLLLLLILFLLLLLLLLLQTLGRLGYGANLIGLCEVEDIDGTRVVTIRSSIQVCVCVHVTVCGCVCACVCVDVRVHYVCVHMCACARCYTRCWYADQERVSLEVDSVCTQ